MSHFCLKYGCIHLDFYYYLYGLSWHGMESQLSLRGPRVDSLQCQTLLSLTIQLSLLSPFVDSLQCQPLLSLTAHIPMVDIKQTLIARYSERKTDSADVTSRLYLQWQVELQFIK
ncbi:uncharacterized protein [Watersipora subatra]|uniref:uncharacterized protein n=1 Tax=Watersipora subatra TaxID=2589382 RepID=UPI00355BDD6D